MMGAGIASSPVSATARVLATLSEMVTRSGTKERLRFTAALADGQNLYAFRYAVNDSANTLYYRAAATGVVIVSEPLDREADSWKPVPENSVLVARAGQPIKIEPLFQPRKVAA
jgi:predicted glutamine amidotransferase